MKARELKELRSSNPQDLAVKLGDLKAEFQLKIPTSYRTIRKSNENKRS